MYTLPDFDFALAHSIQTILWQAGEVTDENGEFTGESYDEICNDENIHVTTAGQIISDLYTMIARCDPQDIVSYLDAQNGWSDFIHDYWLTRNGHGTGFWDRGLGDLGDRLTTLSHDGEYHVWVSTPENLDHVDGYIGWFYE